MDSKLLWCLRLTCVVLLWMSYGKTEEISDDHGTVLSDEEQVEYKIQLEQAGSIIENVSKSWKDVSLQSVMAALASAAEPFEKFGAVLGAVSYGFGAFLDDEKHREILRRFDHLHSNITAVRYDISRLEQVIKWEATKLHYAEVVRTIKEMSRLTNKTAEHAMNRDLAAVERTKEDLKALCNNHHCYMCVKTLFDGVVGQGDFHNNILDYYYTTSEGNRTGLALLATRLLQLLTAGETAYLTYKAAQGGINATSDYADVFDGLMKASKQKIEAALQKCKDNVRTNMRGDMEVVMHEGGSVQAVSQAMHNRLKSKYDWLYLTTVVYDKRGLFSTWSHTGNSLEVKDKNGKNALVVYRDKEEITYYPHSLPEANRVANKHKDYNKYGNSGLAYNAIRDDLVAAKVKWDALIVEWVLKPCPGSTVYYQTLCQTQSMFAYTSDWPNIAEARGNCRILIHCGES